MPNLENLTFTHEGKTGQSYALSGWAMCNMEMCFDDHHIPAGYTAATMTADMAAITNAKIKVPLNKIERLTNGNVIFGAVMSNAALTEDFEYRALALTCYVESGSQDDGTYQRRGPFLLAYGNAGDQPDNIPAYNGNAAIEKQTDVYLAIGNDAVINLSIASGIYATPKQVEEATKIEDAATGAKYKIGVENGIVYIEEVA